MIKGKCITVYEMIHNPRHDSLFTYPEMHFAGDEPVFPNFNNRLFKKTAFKHLFVQEPKVCFHY